MLQPRLLLCLHGLGTNAGFAAHGWVGIGHDRQRLGLCASALHQRRSMRRAIAIVADGTLHARNPAIWGDRTTACASDSKHFGAWDQNLTTQWHIRYGGRGVMIYWHVEQQSLCIHSHSSRHRRRKWPSMIEGVIHHCTEMEVERQYVDSHGQSTVAFAFCRLLGLPVVATLKSIHWQKLYRPEAGKPDVTRNLQRF